MHNKRFQNLLYLLFECYQRSLFILNKVIKFIDLDYFSDHPKNLKIVLIKSTDISLGVNILSFRSKFQFLTEELATKGFFVVDNVFDGSIFNELLTYFDGQQDKLRPATIGHKSSKHLDKTLRSDSIQWIEEDTTVLQPYFVMIQEVINYLKQDLYLPIRRTETQMALYQPGDFYLPHQDRHKNSSHRWVTLVYYLNQAWSKEDGGELIIFPNSNANWSEQKVVPVANRLVIFLSELEHEVKITSKIRKSFTTWFRDDV